MNSEDIVRILMTNTLGESILVETLRSAAFFITRSGNQVTFSSSGTGYYEKYGKRYYHRVFLEAKECYFFVQSTGLDLLIQRFNLDYDPDELRKGFEYYVRHT